MTRPPPKMRGSKIPPPGPSVTRLPGGSFLVTDLKTIFELNASTAFIRSLRVRTVVAGGSVLDDVEVELDVEVEVVVAPGGMLPGSAGSEPASISVRSKCPSPSRSTPNWMPEPGGTQV